MTLARSLANRATDFVSVRDYGVVGDGTTDDTAHLQTAISSGNNLIFPAGTYPCANLTGTTAQQRFMATGRAILRKNDDGPILTHSGAYVEFDGIEFRGESATPAFTGHNLVLSGNHPRLINCGSRWAYDRAVLATGSHVQIIGTCDIYQTTDATGDGYDIEIGVSGTATLYHQLLGIYTSQATGGIKLIDTGSHVIVGGQFGKLWIAAGTQPSGINGGNTMGARILGGITVDVSSSVIVGNTIGAATAVVFGAATSNCQLIGNAGGSGYTVTNNGSATNFIHRNYDGGSNVEAKYGDDANAIGFTMNFGDWIKPSHAVRFDNNVGVRLEDTGGVSVGLFSCTTGNNVVLQNTHATGNMQISALGSLVVRLFHDGVEKLRAAAAGVYLGGTTSFITQGADTPEGAVTAPVGSLFLRTNGGAGTTFYVKESGSGNTGWVGK